MVSKLFQVAMSLLRKLSNFLPEHRHQRLRKGCRFTFKEIEELVTLIIGGIIYFGMFIYTCLQLWMDGAEEVSLSVTKDNQNCWHADVNITDDNGRPIDEIPILLQICAESNATRLQIFHVDSASVKVSQLRGGSFQIISGEVPCIGKDCPPVSIFDNYIGIPTSDQVTNKTHFYIFLLPTLGPRNSGIVDSQESIDMLWKGVISRFYHKIVLTPGVCLIILSVWKSAPFIYYFLRQRLWGTPIAVDSVRCTARLHLVNEEDIVDIEDFPSSEPGISSANSDQIFTESPSNASCHPNRMVRRSNSCPDLRRRVYLYDSGTMSMDDLSVPVGQRSEVSSDCESVVSVYQEQNRFEPLRPIYQRTGVWYDSGTSDNQTSESSETGETSESDDDHVSVTSEDYDTSSDSSFSAVEDTHSPPVRVVSFSSEGVVFEDYSEQTRQDPVGGE